MEKQTPFVPAESLVFGSASMQPEILRDPEELEGSLLEPLVGTAVGNVAVASSSNVVPLPNATAVTAVGTASYVDYATALVEEREEELRREHIAAAIPTDTECDPTTVNALMDRVRANVGEKKGRLAAEQEIEEIRRANRDVSSINYHTREQIRAANQLATSRNVREEIMGITPSLEFQAPHFSFNTNTWPTECNLASATPGKKTGGYEIREYSTMEYDTSDYEISEYKSIYD